MHQQSEIPDPQSNISPIRSAEKLQKVTLIPPAVWIYSFYPLFRGTNASPSNPQSTILNHKFAYSFLLSFPRNECLLPQSPFLNPQFLPPFSNTFLLSLC